MNTPQFIIDELNKGLDGFTSTSIEMPEIGAAVLVKMRLGEVQTRYAIYSAENEFDVHQPKNPYGKDYRTAWYKFSKASVKSWKLIE